MEEVKRDNRPQDEIPTEVIIHYIVKDYRRMFLQEEDYKSRIEQHKRTIQNFREKIMKLIREIRDKQVAAMTDEEVKTHIAKLTASLDRKDEKIAQREQTIETLYSQIEDTKNSRNAVVEAVVDDLEAQLREANEKIAILSQGGVEGVSPDSVFLQRCKVHCIESDDDRKWMVGAMKQLEKAGMQLIATEQRLADLDDMIEGSFGDEEKKKLSKKINTILSKVNSTVSHIENFFDKVGDIKIEDE